MNRRLKMALFLFVALSFCAASISFAAAGSGSPCSNDSACSSNICNSVEHKCQAGKLGTGSPCGRDVECASNKCVSGKCSP